MSSTPTDTADLVVRNPATGDVVAHVATQGPLDVPSLAAAARSAQVGWEQAGWRHRARIIARFHDLLLERADEALDVVQSESGKARRDALAEVVSVAATARHYVAHGRRYLADTAAQGALPFVTAGTTAWHPHALVGLITPWNFPLLLGVADALPALLAGAAVMTKPSELTPRSTLFARDLLVEAGLDPALFTPLVGEGSVLGPALIDVVDYVGFTGSTRTGRSVAHAAAERLIPCSLELGGKNAMLVLPGCRIDDAVEGLMSAVFANSGQTCICIERVFVHESLWDAFVARARERAEQLRVGWSTTWDADIGSLISADHADQVRRHIREACDLGATVLVGGPDGGGDFPTSAFQAPTLLTDVSHEATMYREETFGPVAYLERVASVDEAVARANDSQYGLNASVWAGSGARARAIARRVAAGSVNLNSTLLIYGTLGVPMGGIRASGIGRRHGAAGIRRFCREQSIVESFGRGGGYELLLRAMDSPRRARMLLRAMRLWRRVPGLR